MSDENKVISFALTLERIHVELERPDGSKRQCYLQEFNGFERDKYLNKETAKVNAAKKTLNDFTDVQTMLIAASLHDSETNELVSIQDIRDFPAKTQMGLHKLAQELNGFDKQAGAVKND